MTLTVVVTNVVPSGSGSSAHHQQPHYHKSWLSREISGQLSLCVLGTSKFMVKQKKNGGEGGILEFVLKITLCSFCFVALYFWKNEKKRERKRRGYITWTGRLLGGIVACKTADILSRVYENSFLSISMVAGPSTWLWAPVNLILQALY